MKWLIRTACFAGCVLLLGCISLHAQTQPEPASFTDVLKIFNSRCISCHSGSRPPEGLRLDTYKDIMAGGKGGPVVVPKDPAKSELVKRVKGIISPRMPKNGPPWLQDAEISLIEKWIADGAKDTAKSAD